MNTDESALFVISGGRSAPFHSNSTAPQRVLRFGRRITNVSYSSEDAADLTFEDTGETALILGWNLDGGTIVHCFRINRQWFAVRPAFRAVITSVVDNDNEGDGEEVTVFQFFHPYSVELITTGNLKHELDGLYQLIPRFNGNENKRDFISHGCIDTSSTMHKKAGANIRMEYYGVQAPTEKQVLFRLTVTHPDIETTVYDDQIDSDDFLTKTSGDSRLPDDVWWGIGLDGALPLWFEIEDSDCEEMNGLYTLWPTYYRESSNSYSAQSKDFIHKKDGTRQDRVYSLQYFHGLWFRIQIEAPGGALNYTCLLENFSFENGSKMTFELNPNASNCTAPETIEVRRAQTGYCRTVKLEDQL